MLLCLVLMQLLFATFNEDVKNNVGDLVTNYSNERNDIIDYWSVCLDLYP